MRRSRGLPPGLELPRWCGAVDRLLPAPAAGGIDVDTLRFVAALSVGFLAFMLAPWAVYHVRLVPDAARTPLAFALVLAIGMALLAYSLVGFPFGYPSG